VIGNGHPSALSPDHRRHRTDGRPDHHRPGWREPHPPQPSPGRYHPQRSWL